ncbi:MULTISPECIES: hypothetical protein [Clostridia]|jgi:hypothetical protein|uniref:hypothetical protein n=1 Tax=Mediterraneibacter sp. ICN-202921 TaxID=3134657 RepID=UPI00073E8479|nr:hypothetical protein DWX08_07935 [Ruminococcus sp. AF18-22]
MERQYKERLPGLDKRKFSVLRFLLPYEEKAMMKRVRFLEFYRESCMMRRDEGRKAEDGF